LHPAVDLAGGATPDLANGAPDLVPAGPDLGCGGGGDPCPDGTPCRFDADCASLTCSRGACVPAHCANGSWDANDGESDADCRGCAPGTICNRGGNADCAACDCEYCLYSPGIARCGGGC